jgi:hypothetical protein
LKELQIVFKMKGITKMTNEEMIKWIDSATYYDLFYKWRKSPSGNPFFQGEVGKYYSRVMAQRREEVGPAEHTRISKLIGLD